MKRFLSEILPMAVETKDPVLLVGAPGIGKTAMCAVGAKKYNMRFMPFILTYTDPTDIKGVFARLANGDADWTPPRIAKILKEEPCLLLLDELSTAPPVVQSMAYQILCEKRFGDVPMHPDTVTISCANPVEEGGQFDIMLPVIGRLKKYEVHADLEGTLEYFNDTYGENAHSVIGYLRRNPSDIHILPKDGRIEPFPSPRSWEKIIRSAMAAKKLGLSAEGFAGEAIATIGEGYGTKFLTYLKALNLPSLEQVLSKDWSPKELTSDIAYIVCGMLASCAKEAKGKTLNSLWEAMKKLLDTPNRDVAALFVRKISEGGKTPPYEIINQVGEFFI